MLSLVKAAGQGVLQSHRQPAGPATGAQGDGFQLSQVLAQRPAGRAAHRAVPHLVDVRYAVVHYIGCNSTIIQGALPMGMTPPVVLIHVICCAMVR